MKPSIRWRGHEVILTCGECLTATLILDAVDDAIPALALARILVQRASAWHWRVAIVAPLDAPGRSVVPTSLLCPTCIINDAEARASKIGDIAAALGLPSNTAPDDVVSYARQLMPGRMVAAHERVHREIGSTLTPRGVARLKAAIAEAAREALSPGMSEGDRDPFFAKESSGRYGDFIMRDPRTPDEECAEGYHVEGRMGVLICESVHPDYRAQILEDLNAHEWAKRKPEPDRVGDEPRLPSGAPRCEMCGGNRDTCGHFVGGGAG